MLQTGELYKFEKFYVRPAVRSSAIGDSPFELEIKEDTIITPVEDIESFCALDPEVFTKLKKVKTLQDGERVSKY